jgi:hypothetical protein
LLLLLSLPELAYGQQLVAYGTWSGYFTYTQTDYDRPFGNVIGGYSLDGNSTLTVDIFEQPGSPTVNFFYATLSGSPGFLPGDTYNLSTFGFGPTSASGFTEAGGIAGFEGSFDVTYRSILPDGEIDTTGGFAVADFGAQSFTIGQPWAVFSASFTTASVPEPSAIVPMAIGAVVVVTWVVIRRRRAGKPLARAIAAGGLQ